MLISSNYYISSVCPSNFKIASMTSFISYNEWIAYMCASAPHRHTTEGEDGIHDPETMREYVAAEI